MEISHCLPAVLNFIDKLLVFIFIFKYKKDTYNFAQIYY